MAEDWRHQLADFRASMTDDDRQPIPRKQRDVRPSWTCRKCGSTRVVELHMADRHAGCCTGCGFGWGDTWLLLAVARTVPGENDER